LHNEITTITKQTQDAIIMTIATVIIPIALQYLQHMQLVRVRL